MTISPTHVPGKKEFAWKEFLKGEYVAIGWLHDYDLTGKNIDEIIDLIRMENYDNEASAIDSFTKFFALNIGDYVGVNNTNSGLFGVGVVTSGYKYEKFKHNTGDDEDEESFYPHFRTVDWKYTSYVRRKDIIGPNETGWRPYGTVGSLEEEAHAKGFSIRKTVSGLLIVPVKKTGEPLTEEEFEGLEAGTKKKIEELSRKKRVKPAFKGYKGYPFALCTSVNGGVVH